ncbi:hypothetical protein MLD38_020148 [Melastoma candidum]|nr:hypothetical protein MLD38_020148 [Melastoma candidum]
MFLSDCDLLVENYHVLCNYGIPRCKIGKIYWEAPEVFQYDLGVLLRKIKAYEEMGISQLVLHRIIVISPRILIGDPNVHFCKVMEKLCSLGFELNWITVQLSETSYCRWSQMLEILSVFEKMGFGDEQLRRLIDRRPGLVFENSGKESASFIGFLVKFGSTKDELRAMFVKFPPMQVKKFVSNIRQCFLFFVEIDMGAEDIDRIIRAETLLLGSCTLKTLNSLLSILNVGKKRLCELVTKNPQEMKNWVLRLRVKPIQNSSDSDRYNEEKKNFLLGLGIVRDSNEMKRALKVFRGKRAELQERFDCIVKAGIDREVVCKMVRLSPQILNQTKEVLELKIDYLVRELQKPLSSLVKFPAYLSFNMDRIKLRYLMFNWLTEQAVVSPNIAVSTIIACSEKMFVDKYVNRHPDGVVVWENLKRTSGYK